MRRPVLTAMFLIATAIGSGATNLAFWKPAYATDDIRPAASDTSLLSKRGLEITEAPKRPLPRLIVGEARGRTGAPFKLGMAIETPNEADLEEYLVHLRGVPAQAKLSTGINVGHGEWMAEATRLNDLTMLTPNGLAVGSYEGDALLMRGAACFPDASGRVPFVLHVAHPTASAQPPNEPLALGIAPGADAPLK